MLYSHNSDKEKLNLFMLFLKKAYEGESKYANIVNDVIYETHLFVIGEKNLYNINRDSINIILLLADLKEDFFRNLDTSQGNYNRETYSQVLSFLDVKKPSFAFQ